eukprot:TRINITY_DN1342_c0_g1_i2.p1 TRINITY_DN1342_c0_g1~~TRINITY_DN1342_c0_g1_i2.p1  ORF type:complete len:148 (+),score=42.68 TRINITY_DN1342_c0_g1_i2:42-485(+)
MGMFVAAVLFAVSFAAFELKDDDEFLEFDPEVCPNKGAEQAANLCIVKESGLSAEAMATLVWLNENGPDELPDHDREHLCKSITPRAVASMKKCKTLNNCNEKMFCTLQQYKNLRSIGCSKEETTRLCETIITNDHTELGKFGSVNQ